MAEQGVKKGDKKMIIGINLFFPSRRVVLGAMSAVFITIIPIGNNMRLRYNCKIKDPARTILQ